MNCQALVLVDNGANSGDNRVKASGRVADMIKQLEGDGISFAGRSNLNSGYKEKGITIKVKKNQVEETKPENKDETIKSPKKEEKSKTTNKENGVIDYADFTIEEEEYIQPLI
jgi:hypothetical protein